ncbi:GLPGLI family protein [Lutibacter sp. B1]|uniref:GLPGLI family protein n=1 Tax=Lutibacter sp. B1 TaxID=2725996 RepID=UPI00145679CE|nr:GLPGLI family protein [Lutibacter sp. B1]NLP58585.1 GLPGLI family protein [Lutibacter sp. B1]
MKSVFFKNIVVAVLFISTSVIAQDFQGMAVYQTKTKLDVNFDDSRIPADRVKRIQEMMKNQLEKTYVLTFDKTASIYKEEEKLDQSNGGRGGMRFMMMGGASSGKQYKNILEKRLVKEQEFSGKNFLIVDELTPYAWKMEQETKMIGNNMCFKATAVIKEEKKEALKFGPPSNDEEENKEDKPKEMVDVIITAWYTLDIPVSNGPANYWGLPGLILEVSAGNTQILCTKIVMNPKEKVEISEPKKGKEVTQAEFDEIMKEKMIEMRERFRNERQKNDGGQHFRIRG